MGQLQQRHHDDGGSPSPSSFHSHFSSIRTFFIVSLLVFITVNGVGAVRALAMFWCVCACQKLPFPKNMPLEKPKWYVEDDEEMIEKARYLRPVAGRATTCRKAKCLFPCHQPEDRAALSFARMRKTRMTAPVAYSSTLNSRIPIPEAKRSTAVRLAQRRTGSRRERIGNQVVARRVESVQPSPPGPRVTKIPEQRRSR